MKIKDTRQLATKRSSLDTRIPDLENKILHDASASKDAANLASIKVCMHVLTRAATDGRVMRAATALVKAGCGVSIVDIEDKENPQKDEFMRGVSIKHIRLSRSFFSTRFDSWTFIRVAQLFVRSTFRVMRTPADIYHAHDVSALPTCYIAACLRGKSVVFEAHEMPLFERALSEMSMSRRILCRLLAILLAHMLPRCAGIITVSPPIVEEIRNRYNVAEVILIRSVPEYQIVTKSNQLRHCLGIQPEVRIALYQGYLQANRGLDRLVQAAAFLKPGIVIVIMGKNTGTTQLQLEALIASEGVSDRIKILPPVPYTELLHWTSSADIGLNVASPDFSLNVRYFLPNKLFEYLMAGLPVLTSPLEAIVDVVKTYDVGQVLSSLKPADIGVAINSMLADPNRLACQSRNALEAARNEFYWEKESLQLVSLYQDIYQKKYQRVHLAKGSNSNGTNG